MKISERNIISGITLSLFLSLATGTLVKAAEHVPGRLLVRIKASKNKSDVERDLKSKGYSKKGEVSDIGVSIINVPENKIDQVKDELENSGNFDFVEQDHIGHGSGTPNDPSFSQQWHLSQIQAPLAWDTTVGSASVPIAMIDSGVDSTHPDLAGKVMPGWSFLTGTTNTSDVQGHGTATAGTVGAATNNSMGVSGVTWLNPIMPLVVLNSSDFALYSDIASAINYAANHNVRIINISISGTSSSSTIQSAVDYAWNKGSIIFAGAGNNSSSALGYPAACNHVVAVSATESNDTLSSFSSYGSWISLSAPGNNILTLSNGGGYSTWYGTSFASPIAAGVAALMLSANSNLSADQVVNLIEQNSDDIGAPGFDSSFGWGRVNAARAVAAAQSAQASVSSSTTTTSTTITTTTTSTTNTTVAPLSTTIKGHHHK
jgi:thermitase